MTETNQQGQEREIRILMVPANLFAEEESKQSFFSRKIFTIQRAGTAKGAVEMASKNPPHLIIFSNQIKDMSAEQFCRTIRGASGSQQTRLLMLTDMLTDSASSADGEADAHLVNPVDDQQLFKTVAELLNIRVRCATRVAVDFISQVELFPKGDVDDLRFIANVLNVSETGMRVESPLELPVGSLGRLRFFLPGASDSLLLYCLVKVVADEVCLHYGLEFIGNTAREKQLLKQFVQNHSEGGSTG